MSTLDETIRSLSRESLPRHVAIIMDGNGRWARQRGLPRSAGHYKGVDSVRVITEMASDIGLEYLSLYAFSTENWSRPQEEVDTLMHLIGMAIENETPALLRNNVRLKLVGDIEGLPAEARERLERSSRRLEGNTGLTLALCLNYSSRWELSRAARRIARDAAEGRLDPEAVDSDEIERRLSTFPMPDPDLLIRTGGELRISNFMLWQAAYTEFCFTPTLWPDFDKLSFAQALLQYRGRERRFGKTSEQVKRQDTKTSI